MSTTVSAAPASRPSSRAAYSRPASRASIGRAPSPALNGISLPTPPPSQSNQRSLGSKRRSSFEALSAIASNGNTESYLPLPVDNRNGLPASIKEGVPIDLRPDTPGLERTKSHSPTRSLSRIPMSSVGHARALAEDGSSTSSGNPLPSPGLSSNDPLSPTLGDLMPSPSSPSFSGKISNRKSLGSGNTTKVLAELQAGVSNAKNALENTKSQLRISQRQVAQLTRQNEDLKDGRERMRMENEGLNNVVARKERLLQELLERARKAEAEAASLKAQLKTDNATNKKTIKDMETGLTEAVAVSQRTSREYLTLSESMKGMTKGWKTEVEGLRKEINEREEKHKKEIEEVNLKYKSLVKLVQASKAEKARLDGLKSEARQLDSDFVSLIRPQLMQLVEGTSNAESDSAEALQIAHGIQDELARIRRLMRIGQGPPLPNEDDA